MLYHYHLIIPIKSGKTAVYISSLYRGKYRITCRYSQNIAGTAVAYLAPVIWGAFIPVWGRVGAIRATFTVMAVVAFFCMQVPVWSIREKEYVDTVPSQDTAFSSLASTFRNREFLKFVGSDILYWIAITMFQTGLPFFVTSLLGYGFLTYGGFGILPQAVVADIAQSDAKRTGSNREGMLYAARTFAFKLGQSLSMLLFTAVSTVGNSTGTGYRIAAFSAACFCFLGGILFLFYDEHKISRDIR